MTNAVLESLRERRSVRAFTDREISPEEREAILLGAVEAPTAGNQQLYTILDITDPKLKELLAVTCDNQPFIAKAKLVLIFCADQQRWTDAYKEAGAACRKPGPGDLMLAAADAVIAAQNAVTAAESLGIGSCYIGDILERCEEHRALLQLPPYVFPAAMVVFGYPTKQQQTREKPRRFKLSDVVSINAYARKDGAALREMFQERTEKTGFDKWMQAFCKRKFDSDFAREMSRSVGEYWKAYREEEK